MVKKILVLIVIAFITCVSFSGATNFINNSEDKSISRASEASSDENSDYWNWFSITPNYSAF